MAAPAVPMPPPGHLYDSHDTEIIATASVFAVVMTAAFIIRLISIRKRNNRYQFDDLLLLIAYLPALLEICFFAWASKNIGLGRHLASLSEKQIVWFEKMFFATIFTHDTSLAAAKLSLIWLLYRVFAVRKFRWAMWVLAVVVLLWWAISILVTCFNCIPINKLWNPAIPGHCGNQRAIQISTPIPWIVTDLAVLLAPMPVIKNLHLPSAQKWGLALLFLLGSLTVIATCVRYTTVWYPASDIPWDVHAAACWNIVEVSMGVIVVSLIVSRPVLGPLLPHELLRRIRDSMSKVTPSFARGNKTSWIATKIRRSPKDAPRLPTFEDSDLKLAQKEHEAEKAANSSKHGTSMSTRGDIEKYAGTSTDSD